MSSNPILCKLKEDFPNGLTVGDLTKINSKIGYKGYSVPSGPHPNLCHKSVEKKKCFALPEESMENIVNSINTQIKSTLCVKPKIPTTTPDESVMYMPDDDERGGGKRRHKKSRKSRRNRRKKTRRTK